MLQAGIVEGTDVEVLSNLIFWENFKVQMGLVQAF